MWHFTNVREPGNCFICFRSLAFSSFLLHVQLHVIRLFVIGIESITAHLLRSDIRGVLVASAVAVAIAMALARSIVVPHIISQKPECHTGLS